MERTTACGLVDAQYLNKTISLAGWVNKRRDHGGLIFIDLRDRTGIMQLVFNPKTAPQIHARGHALRAEYVIAVTGLIIERSAETINKDITTGQWEMLVNDFEVLNVAKALPFSPEDSAQVDEELRLKYRYLDLRRAQMHEHFSFRHKVIFAFREFLHKQTFYEIETPLLTKNTPEGAREFVVPSRINQGMFYALPQSPQLYKQILMCGGMEKYFQIARCFRDEDLRADRQPEFTQLDIELSFTNEIEIQTLIEKMLNHVFVNLFGRELEIPFKRLSYDDTFSQYGSDKPDLRFELKIQDCAQLFHDTKLTFLRDIMTRGGKIGGIHVAHNFTHSELNRWVDKVQKIGAKGLLWIAFEHDYTISSPVSKFLPEDFFVRVQTLFPEVRVGSVLFIIAGEYNVAWEFLGRLRLEIAKELQIIPEREFNFSWITDFPLLEFDEKDKRWNAKHHPFTSPEKDWQEKNNNDIKARAYDIVLNGVELGGGSIRIHDRATQEKMFELLGLTAQEVEAKFGFLLEAQELGFPPHGGIALGVDRFIMLLMHASSIREVIAFPKTARGYDPMMACPTPLDQTQLREYGMRSITVHKE